MDDLTAFVRARLADVEATARAALESEWFAHVTEFASANHYDTFGDLAVDYWQWFPGEADGVHAARHDPARVLRDVAADRKLLFQYEVGKALLPGQYKLGYCEALEDVIKIRAERWSDHPDYRAEWAPS